MTTPDKAGLTSFSTPSDREIEITRVVDAPRRLVWDAHTRPEHVPRWLLGPEGWTMPVCEIDLRPGGSWRYVWRKADGAERAMSGAYREVDPPARLVATESWGPDWPETIDTLTLTEFDGGTTITQCVLYPSKEAHDAALGSGMKEVMAAGYDRLDAYLRAIA